ncbi:hypothetical protein EVAR_11173_1 [Eumeta japonica]|uniref:Uncharacterized protein n=1 Tax=Eumeta variegata TaxID=151549 RepID=A0A4C1U491_EUMVA|nr:hypothetical protein EVAR_11173_1 [Eumeta japonica]
MNNKNKIKLAAAVEPFRGRRAARTAPARRTRAALSQNEEDRALTDRRRFVRALTERRKKHWVMCMYSSHDSRVLPTLTVRAENTLMCMSGEAEKYQYIVLKKRYFNQLILKYSTDSVTLNRYLFFFSSSSLLSLNLQPVAITEKDKSRYTDARVNIVPPYNFPVQGLVCIRSDGSVEPAGIHTTFSQNLLPMQNQDRQILLTLRLLTPRSIGARGAERPADIATVKKTFGVIYQRRSAATCADSDKGPRPRPPTAQGGGPEEELNSRVTRRTRPAKSRPALPRWFMSTFYVADDGRPPTPPARLDRCANIVAGHDFTTGRAAHADRTARGDVAASGRTLRVRVHDNRRADISAAEGRRPHPGDAGAAECRVDPGGRAPTGRGRAGTQ